MKFHQLPIGARFTFRDDTYRKISPLKAENEADGSHRLIPRSAAVSRRADDPAAAAAAAPRVPDSVPGAALETATWTMVDDCRHALGRIDPPLTEGQRAQVVTALELAAQELLSALAAR